MKTPPVKFRFVVLGVIVIVAIVSCCPFPTFPVITGTTSFAVAYIRPGPRTTGPTYHEWKDKVTFENALAQVHAHGGQICICVLESSGGTPYSHKWNNDCLRNYHCPSEKIRTVKVTKSKAAENIAAGESAVNDPNITYRVQSPVPGDIAAVLDALK